MSEDKDNRLEQAMQLIGRATHALLATVDETGIPRMTPGEECTLAGDGLADIEQETRFPQTERLIVTQVESIEEFRFASAQPPWPSK